MADRISELHRLTFLSNSDAHSPWPNKMGREFNTLSIQDISYEEIEKAIKREGGRKFVMNVGFNPLEGKYHKTRCLNCLTFFQPKDAEVYKWRCPSCKSSIKKGADARIDELSDVPEGQHPDHRPPYIYTIPLSEMIAIAIGVKQAYSQKVQVVWENFTHKFGSEITILLHTPISELKEIEPKTAEMVHLFRNNQFKYIPGGGGVYGIPVPPGKKLEINIWSNGKVQKLADEKKESGQKSLDEFF
jgi:uncharacterized protein (TIGR00375 family)